MILEGNFVIAYLLRIEGKQMITMYANAEVFDVDHACKLPCSVAVSATPRCQYYIMLLAPKLKFTKF